MSHQSEGGAFIFGLLAGVIVGVGVAMPIYLYAIGSTDKGILQHQQTAIDAGHAEWVVNQKTGERAFKWKPTAEVEEFPVEEAPK